MFRLHRAVQDGVAKMLPVLHKYNMGRLLDQCMEWINVGSRFSTTLGDDAYVLRSASQTACRADTAAKIMQ